MSPSLPLPSAGVKLASVDEPTVNATIILPDEFIGTIMEVLHRRPCALRRFEGWKVWGRQRRRGGDGLTGGANCAGTGEADLSPDSASSPPPNTPTHIPHSTPSVPVQLCLARRGEQTEHVSLGGQRSMLKYESGDPLPLPFPSPPLPSLLDLWTQVHLAALQIHSSPQ